MEITNPLHLSIDGLAAGLTHCFEGYFMPANFTGALVAAMVRIESVDLANSFVAEEDGVIVGAALVARRDTTARVAAMAIAKSHRGQGLGKQLMNKVVLGALQRGEDKLVLEVIDQNEPAIKLYESIGMTRDYRLLGFKCQLADFEPAGEIEEVPLSVAAAAVRARGAQGSSWSMSAANIEQLALPATGARASGVCAVVGPAGEGKVACRSLAFESEPSVEAALGWLRAMAASYPGEELHMPAFYPEPEFGKAMFGAGMKPDDINQYQMSMSLGSEFLTKSG